MNNTSQTNQILTQIINNFDFLCCNSFFCPFYEVFTITVFLISILWCLEQEFFLRIIKIPTKIKMQHFIWKNEFKQPIFNNVGDIQAVNMCFKLESICITGSWDMNKCRSFLLTEGRRQTDRSREKWECYYRSRRSRACQTWMYEKEYFSRVGIIFLHFISFIVY